MATISSMKQTVRSRRPDGRAPLVPTKRHVPFVWSLCAASALLLALTGCGSEDTAAPTPTTGSVATITTVAGTGVAGFNGDNQPATAAQLDHPAGVAVDGAGNLLIADATNQRIRRVDAQTGVITTVAGTGVAGFNGDNQPATDAQVNFLAGVAVDGAGNLLIADDDNHRVRRVGP